MSRGERERLSSGRRSVLEKKTRSSALELSSTSDALDWVKRQSQSAGQRERVWSRRKAENYNVVRRRPASQPDVVLWLLVAAPTVAW